MDLSDLRDATSFLLDGVGLPAAKIAKL